MVVNITKHENTRTISRTSHSVNSVEQISLPFHTQSIPFHTQSIPFHIQSIHRTQFYARTQIKIKWRHLHSIPETSADAQKHIETVQDDNTHACLHSSVANY